MNAPSKDMCNGTKQGWIAEEALGRFLIVAEDDAKRFLDEIDYYCCLEPPTVMPPDFDDVIDEVCYYPNGNDQDCYTIKETPTSSDLPRGK